MGRVLCGVWRRVGWRSLTRGRLAGVWPGLVALPPFLAFGRGHVGGDFARWVAGWFASW